MIIGLHGLPGSGKDTIAQRLAEYSSLPVERRAFADKMKQSICALLDITIEQFEHLKRQENWPAIEVNDDKRALGLAQLSSMNMRTFIQRYGTEAHRDVFGYSFWIDQCLPNTDTRLGVLDFAEMKKKLVVVTDVRFMNEGERVLDLGGEMWLVTGPSKKGSDHISDQPLDLPYTLAIENSMREGDFSIGYLDHQLRAALKTRGIYAVKSDEAASTRSAAGV